MSSKYRSLLEPEEKEASFRKYLDEENFTKDTRHDRMKEIMLRGIKTELTDRQRDCICMRYIDGLTADAISQRLGLTKATVYKHIRTGFKKLRRLEAYI